MNTTIDALAIIGFWFSLALLATGLWCSSLRWLADRRARANVSPFPDGVIRRRKGYDYQREWPIAISCQLCREVRWHTTDECVDQQRLIRYGLSRSGAFAVAEERASGGEAA